jgi:hypothetical protein
MQNQTKKFKLKCNISHKIEIANSTLRNDAFKATNIDFKILFYIRHYAIKKLSIISWNVAISNDVTYTLEDVK